MRSVRFAIAFPLVVAALGAFLATPAGASPPALSVTLSGSATGTVAAGDTITYTVTIDNAGTTGSGLVTVADDLPGIYVPGSATCGTVSGCTVNVSMAAVSCPVYPPGATGICGGPSSVEWSISTVPGGAGPQTLTFQTTVLPYYPFSDTATWTGYGCSVSLGCQTDTVSNPVADVTVTQTGSPPNGTTVVPGQSIGYTLVVANVGDAPSGTITVVDDVLGAGDTSVIPGSATCGGVAACTVTVGPEAAAGNTVTWVIASVPAGATGLDLGFAVIVNAGATRTIVNHAGWNGSISPPIKIVRTETGATSPLFSSGDGCVWTGANADVAGDPGCLLAFDSNPVTPTPPTTTTTTPPVHPPTNPSTGPGVVTAPSRSLAFTGPGSAIRWTGLLGAALSVVGLMLLLGRRRLFSAIAHAATWLLGRSA